LSPGRDRNHLFRIASGSAGEVAASLAMAEAWGYVDASDCAEARSLCDRVLAIFWTLTR